MVARTPARSTPYHKTYGPTPHTTPTQCVPRTQGRAPRRSRAPPSADERDSTAVFVHRRARVRCTAVAHHHSPLVWTSVPHTTKNHTAAKTQNWRKRNDSCARLVSALGVMGASVAGTAHLGDLALGELVMPASATRGDTAGAGSIMVCCPALAPKAFVCHSVQSPKIGGLKKHPPSFKTKVAEQRLNVSVVTHICLDCVLVLVGRCG